MILHKQQNGRAADEADELFSEGRDLLDRADMLMAQVHSASLDGTHANERIRQIMEKARVVIETILNAQDILLPVRWLKPLTRRLNLDFDGLI